MPSDTGMSVSCPPPGTAGFCQAPLPAATSVGGVLPSHPPGRWQRMEAHELVGLFKGS